MTTPSTDGSERARLRTLPRATQRSATPATATWATWGPYVAERAWGTVREDYSEYGDAWEDLPHDQARSRAYRWNEDGMAAVCDDQQRLLLGLALWNGRDPILKERMFGLTGNEGNHGEDVKEYWWYLDSTPTHSWLTWRYHYPQAAFPYDDLVRANAARGRDDPEYELGDTGVFAENRYWRVEVSYAKASPEDLLMRIVVRNMGPEAAELTVLPTVWFRNTWSWGRTTAPRPGLDVDEAGRIRARHPELGLRYLTVADSSAALFCDNESNAERLFGMPNGPEHPKDAINDTVVRGVPRCNPRRRGTKCAVPHVLRVEPGGTEEVRVRLSPRADASLADGFATVLEARRREADEYYAELTDGLTPAEAQVKRQAFAGLLWGKQYYQFDVAEWLDGDPASPPPPSSRRGGRNASWRHLSASGVFSMPDAWEYPWFAAWDLAFQSVALAHVDPEFAKEQLLVLLRERYLHPNGQIPAYEWAFGDVNPPVQAWAAIRVFHCAADRDFEFLEEVFHRLLINFTWWVNRKDARGDNVFEGGFLGLDNIGPLDRSAALPVQGLLEQSDGTAWMAMYCLDMLEIALVLAHHDPSYESMASKFMQHFAYIATAARSQGLWDETDGFYYDVIATPDGRRIPLRVRSLVGLLPITATTTLGEATLQRLPTFAADLEWFAAHRPEFAAAVCFRHERDGATGQLLSLVTPEDLSRILTRLLDEGEFLSPYGLRSLSKAHLEQPFVLDLPGFTAEVGYEPAESKTDVFGGNSNWRGPVWMPTNVLLIQSLRRFARLFGDDRRLEFPTGSGRWVTLAAAADEISDRLLRGFLPDDQGRRAALGSNPPFDDPAWHRDLLFYEYFDGDTGRGLGASHQTGWTALIAELLHHRGASIDDP